MSRKVFVALSLPQSSEIAPHPVHGGPGGEASNRKRVEHCYQEPPSDLTQGRVHLPSKEGSPKGPDVSYIRSLGRANAKRLTLHLLWHLKDLSATTSRNWETLACAAVRCLWGGGRGCKGIKLPARPLFGGGDRRDNQTAARPAVGLAKPNLPLQSNSKLKIPKKDRN